MKQTLRRTTMQKCHLNKAALKLEITITYRCTPEPLGTAFVKRVLKDINYNKKLLLTLVKNNLFTQIVNKQINKQVPSDRTQEL